jgi:hypothetical protein
MDKLCKRCQFRTPSTRALCQVCGHTAFTKIEQAMATADASDCRREASEAGQDVVSTTAPSINLPSIDLESIKVRLQSLKSSVVTEINDLVVKVNSAARKVFLLATTPMASQSEEVPITTEVYARPLQCAVTLPHHASRPVKASTRRNDSLIESAVEIAPGDTVARKARLNELLRWFQSYGDDPLILDKPARIDDTSAGTSGQHAA